MNISFNWLKNYVDTTLSAEEISKVLTDIGLEVEGFEKIETIRGGLAGVVRRSCGIIVPSSVVQDAPAFILFI